MKKLFIVLAAAAVLAGCKDDKPAEVTIEVIKAPAEAVRTVAWYKENKKERLAKLAECANNPGELMDTPNCTNASAASSAITSSSRSSGFNPKW